MITNLFKLIPTIFLRVIGSIMGFVLTFTITHQLPASHSGYFFLVLHGCMIISLIFLFGVQITSMKFISISYEKRDWAAILGDSLVSLSIVVPIAVFSTSLLFIISPHISEHLDSSKNLLLTIRYAAIGSLFMSLSIFFAYQLLGIRKRLLFTTISYINIPFLTSLFCLILKSNTVEKTTFLFTIATAINLVFSIAMWLLNITFSKPRWSSIRKIAGPSYSNGAITVLHMLTMWGSLVIAGFWVTGEDLAILAVAQRVALILGLIVFAAEVYYYPKFAAVSNDRDALRALSAQSVRSISTMGLPILVLIVVFNTQILSLFGDEYKSAHILLFIFLLGQAINIAAGPVGALLTMCGHEKDYRKIIVVTTPFILVTSVIVIQVFGVIGAAAVSALGVALQNILAVLTAKKVLQINMIDGLRFK